MYLRSVELRNPEALPAGFPFELPVVRSLKEIAFHTAVTFFVGENGSGKSTLIEAIAAAVSAVAIGSASIQTDPTLVHARNLARELRLVQGQRPRVRLFFRAEDMFGFTKQLATDLRELTELEDHFDQNLKGYGRQLAMGAARGQRTALAQRYGEDPDALSHGEAFLEILKSRLGGSGLYLLDEPETPLSPTRQLALIALLKDRAQSGSQFIIATHSPILMAFPHARILVFSTQGIAEVPYAEVEHVALTRSFLNNPELYLSKL